MRYTLTLSTFFWTSFPSRSMLNNCQIKQPSPHMSTELSNQLIVNLLQNFCNVTGNSIFTISFWVSRFLVLQAVYEPQQRLALRMAHPRGSWTRNYRASTRRYPWQRIQRNYSRCCDANFHHYLKNSELSVDNS